MQHSSLHPVNISGVFPHTAVKADHLPMRSETGIGALMPWAGKLWFITYVAHKEGTGGGTGLFTIDDELRREKHPASVVGTYANRMIHAESDQLMIGPHFIDVDGNVRTVKDLVHTRLTATCRHLTDPKHKVHVLGMEGEFFEVDVRTLETTKLFELTEELGTSGQADAHFKDAFCDQGRVVVCNNSYYSRDFELGNGSRDGRLAEWDGTEWRVLERTQFNTVSGRIHGELGRSIFAFGQDKASAILRQYAPGEGVWRTYRLPKATHTQDHAWTTEWPRLREIESERWLLNASGMFYELPAMTYGDRVRGLRPVCSHLRIVGDFCSWNGLLVMAGDQATPIHDSNPYVGQPQANLWFGKSDDLWSWGKPTGFGGPWFEAEVKAGRESDPYLFNGFEHKCIHLSDDGKGGDGYDIQVDVSGLGEWKTYMRLETGSAGYAQHTFPTGFSAYWIRVVAKQDAKVTAQLFYT